MQSQHLPRVYLVVDISVLCYVLPSQQSPFLRSTETVIPRALPPIKHRNRVAFDASGILLTLSTNLTALSLAEKHETRPSVLKMNKYKETAVLGSASSWDKVTLRAVRCGLQEYRDYASGQFDRLTVVRLR